MLSIFIAHPIRVQHGLPSQIIVNHRLSALTFCQTFSSVVTVSVCWSETATGICAASFLEVWMHTRLLGGDTGCRIVSQHHFEEVEASWVEV